MARNEPPKEEPAIPMRAEMAARQVTEVLGDDIDGAQTFMDDIHFGQ